MVLRWAFLAVVATVAVAKPFVQNDQKCGYQSCHAVSPDKLNVHLLPHSHDDVGWLKTVDQYFYGSKTSIQDAGVQHIIGSVVDSLNSHPERRFIQVETAFFWQWWQKQDDYVRDIVRRLVNEGRLEIVNGAWSMNDEAATHYHSIIDQFTWGLRMINETLGECGQPKIGWQIDPFGHSNEMASIFAQLGYEAMFFARLDYRDSAKRHKTKTLETMWQPSPNLGNKSNIFTGVLYDFYTTPAYFCWDVLCRDTPIVDDEESPDYNEKKIVNDFAEYVEKGASFFTTNNLLVTMGGDFTYQAAEMFYTNMDKLIKGFKKYRPDINIIYSTPSCYVKAVNDAAAKSKTKFPLKTDDFFPYASGEHTYWTGYFTSRPNSKRFERQGNNMLQVAKQILTFEKNLNGKDFSKNVTLLKEAMGIMQHHDAITGTEKQHVANDYVRIVTKAIGAAESNMGEIVTDLLKKPKSNLKMLLDLESCVMANVSSCARSHADKFSVVVYNPLSRPVTHHVRLPVDLTNFNITGSSKEKVAFDVVPSITSNSTYFKKEKSELVFVAADIPPMGMKYFIVEKNSTKVDKKPEPIKYVFGNNKAGFGLSETTGMLCNVTLNGVTIPITQEFLYYYGSNGSNYGEENRASGAYIFRPANSTQSAVPFTKQAKILKVTTGKLFDEVHQEFNGWVKQVIRVYKDENHIEFDWMVGPIEATHSGVEVVTRFSTKLASEKTFYTDSNGREMIKRIRDFRELYEYTNEEPVSGNYYPITSRIAIKDKKNNIEVAVLNDRAQGGSSLKEGELEIMVHRRLFLDDAFGVGEALNELEDGKPVIVRGQHYLVVANLTTKTSGSNSASHQRDVAQRKLLQPWTFISKGSDKDLKSIHDNINKEFSGLQKALPKNVQILTLEQWSNDRVLLRLEHVFEKDEDVELSKPVIVDLKNLFTLFDVKSLDETMLGANQWVQQNQKLSWNVTTGAIETVKPTIDGQLKNLKVSLKPMEIRTFVMSVTKK